MENLNNMELGRRLAAARVYADKSQTDIVKTARLTGIKGLGKTTLSQIERGVVEPKARILRFLCNQYGVDLVVMTDPRYRPFQDSGGLESKIESLSKTVNLLLAERSRDTESS